MITEVEAYLGAEDKACHSFGNRKTNRTKVMFESGGVAYVYLCYGMHHLFNIVTHQKEVPHAILIRSIKPHYGSEKMLERRGKTKLDKHLCSGPGNLSKALGMTTADTGKTVTGGEIYLEDHGISSLCIKQTPRIGIDYAEEYRGKPWRFVAQ